MGHMKHLYSQITVGENGEASESQLRQEDLSFKKAASSRDVAKRQSSNIIEVIQEEANQSPTKIAETREINKSGRRLKTATENERSFEGRLQVTDSSVDVSHN